MPEINSLPAQLKANAEKFGDRRVAIREKQYGIWQPVTWKGYFEQVRDFALGLKQLGFKKGDNLVYAGDNRPEGLYSELAAQSLGGAIVGIYPDSSLEQMEYIINHSDATFMVAGDQEQADKVLEIKEKCPRLEKVIIDDPKGMRHYQDPMISYFKEIQKTGNKYYLKEPDLFERLIEEITLDDVGVINYTSGTTGLPKGSMITHRNMLRVSEAQEAIDPTRESFQYLSFLPFAWIGEQEFGVYWPICKGFAVNFPEKVETVQENIREIAPHIMLAPPRIWEKICSDIQVKMQEAIWIKRFVYRLLLPIGYRMADFTLQKKRVPFYWLLPALIAYFGLFRSLNNYFGLTRLKHVYTGGAPLGPEIFKLFLALGIKIKQAYGTTELTAAAVCHRIDDIQLDTVGKPLPGLEAAVSDSGELMIKGDTVFKGYFKNPEATAKSIVDGWFYTGDAALINEDGSVTIVDRLADVMKLADGSRFSPQLIENKLKFSQYIMDSVVIGQEKPYITAMIGIDFSNVGKWAENNKIPYTTFTDLSQKPQVYELIAGEVRRTNESLPAVAKIRRFVLFYKELDADDEELTRTRKVRRKFVFKRYEQLVDALYQDESAIDVQADIRYQDGKNYVMKTRVMINQVEPLPREQP